MKDDIAETARAVLAGSARGDDAKRLARWVLEHLEGDAVPEPCLRCDGYGFAPSGDYCPMCNGEGEVLP